MTGFTVFISYNIFTGSIFDVEDREAKTGFLFGITRYNSIPKKTFELRGFVEEIDIVDSFQLASASRFLFIYQVQLHYETTSLHVIMVHVYQHVAFFVNYMLLFFLKISIIRFQIEQIHVLPGWKLPDNRQKQFIVDI